MDVFFVFSFEQENPRIYFLILRISHFPWFELFFAFFGGLECVGHSFAYVALLVVLRDVWIQTQSAAVAIRRATNLATHIPI